MSGRRPALGFRDWALIRAAAILPVLTRVGIRVLVAIPASRLRTRLWEWGLGLGFATSDARNWGFLRGYLHPEARIDLRLAGGWGLDVEREYTGPDGYVEWFTTFTETWSEWQTEVTEVIAPRGNSVIATVRARGRGSGSGAEVGGVLVVCFTYERGWLTTITQFPDTDQALASLGLHRRPPADLP